MRTVLHVPGVRLTLRHRFDFGTDRTLVGDDLVRPAAWDALRIRSGGSFALPATRAEWEALADASTHIRDRAAALNRRLDDAGVSVLASYGAGTALLELWLARQRPDRQLIVTDYAPETVSRLAQLFPEATVAATDLRTDRPLAADAHLFHRIDSELSNAEWRELLDRFAGERLVIVATEVLGPRRIFDEFLLRLPGRTTSQAGWSRTRAAFDALWRETHDAHSIDAHDLPAWWLEPRSGGQAAG